MNRKFWIIAISVLLGATRLLFITHTYNPHITNTYMAAAHLWVGGLIGFWRAWRYDAGVFMAIVDTVVLLLIGWATPSQNYLIRTASVLSVLEIICAIATVLLR